MGDRGDYYTEKGQGSQDAYDAYYDEYGDSSVWQGVNVDTQSNINAHRYGGEAEYITTAESIEDRLDPVEDSNTPIIIIICGIIAYKLLL